MTARERDRLLEREPSKYSTSEPAVSDDVRWVNPGTGEERWHPGGIDPGWDYNPGQHRTLGIHRHEAERHEAALAGRSLPGIAAPVREEVVRTRIQHALAAPGFRWFVNRPRPKMKGPPKHEARDAFVEAAPVAVAPGAILAQTKVSAGRLLYLPGSVADKQWHAHGPQGRRGRHNRVPLDWYADIQAILDVVQPRRTLVWVDARGTVLKRKAARAQAGAREEPRWVYDDAARGRRLVVKRDGAGRLIVVSYHPRPKLKGRAVRRRRGQ